MVQLLNDKGFWKTALKLAIPVAIQNTLVSSFNLADTLFVSSLGDIALSSVGMAGQWSWLMTMVIFGICSATGMFVSQYWGAKNKKEIHVTLGISLLSAVVVTGIFAASGIILPDAVMGMFNRNKEIVLTGSSYLSVVAWAYPGIGITDVLSEVLRSTENPKLPMYISAMTTVSNIFLDYCMIFGRFGFEKMGVKGAALATVISTWTGVVMIIFISVVQKNILITSLRRVFGFHWKRVFVFYKKALPVILNETLWGGGTFLFNLIFSNMGYEYFASMTILKTFENVAFVFFIGLCSACSVMIGKSSGSGKIERGIEDAKRFSVIIPMFAVFVGILIIIFRSQLVSIFNMGNNISSVTMETAKAIMLIYACEMPVRMLPYVHVVGVFRSAGDTVTAAKFDLTSLWLMSLPATAFSVYVLKVPFIAAFVIMYVFEDYFKVFLCIRHFKSLKWIKPVTPQGKKGLQEYLKSRGGTVVD